MSSRMGLDEWRAFLGRCVCSTLAEIKCVVLKCVGMKGESARERICSEPGGVQDGKCGSMA
jgi:hypothetical protein